MIQTAGASRAAENCDTWSIDGAVRIFSASANCNVKISMCRNIISELIWTRVSLFLRKLLDGLRVSGFLIAKLVARESQHLHQQKSCISLRH